MQTGDLCRAEPKITIRKLELSDKGKGFIELLQQLSVCDSVSDEDFEERFNDLSSRGDEHVICVIEDESLAKVVATGSVFIEKKFLRNCGKVAHIEDVVVDSTARGMQLGKRIIEFLTDHALSVGCYKVILDCSVENKCFYEKCGFKQKEIQMVRFYFLKRTLTHLGLDCTLKARHIWTRGKLLVSFDLLDLTNVIPQSMIHNHYEEDRLIWSGVFKVREAYNTTRMTEPKVTWATLI